MPVANAIEVAARINLRIGAGTTRINATRAFEFGIIASFFGISDDARLECTTISGGSPSRR
jgi:hypothetical protein